jgi:hypothetical protein
MDFSPADQREYRASGLIYTLRAANRENRYLLQGKQVRIEQTETQLPYEALRCLKHWFSKLSDS